MAETKRYYCVSGGACSVEWLETERDVIRAIRDANDWDAVAVYETRAPAWSDSPDEERLISEARRQQDEYEAARSRIETAARAIAEEDRPTCAWDELAGYEQQRYLNQAGAALGAADGHEEGSADAG